MPTDNTELVVRLRKYAAGSNDGYLRGCALEAADRIEAADKRIAVLRHIATDLVQHIDWLTCGLPDMLESAALTDEEGLIGAAIDAANSARAALQQKERDDG